MGSRRTFLLLALFPLLAGALSAGRAKWKYDIGCLLVIVSILQLFLLLTFYCVSKLPPELLATFSPHPEHIAHMNYFSALLFFILAGVMGWVLLKRAKQESFSSGLCTNLPKRRNLV